MDETGLGLDGWIPRMLCVINEFSFFRFDYCPGRLFAACLFLRLPEEEFVYAMSCHGPDKCAV